MKLIRITILLMSEDHVTELHHSRINVRILLSPSTAFSLEIGSIWKDKNDTVHSNIRAQINKTNNTAQT